MIPALLEVVKRGGNRHEKRKQRRVAGALSQRELTWGPVERATLAIGVGTCLEWGVKAHREPPDLGIEARQAFFDLSLNKAGEDFRVGFSVAVRMLGENGGAGRRIARGSKRGVERRQFETAINWAVGIK
ncbi:MAG: hypothetical protein V1755_14515 [Chloroflexota bacterium]